MLGLAGGAGFFSTVTYEANIPQIDRGCSRIIFARNRAAYNLQIRCCRRYGSAL